MKTFQKKSIIAGIFIFFLTFFISAQSFILENPPIDKTRFEFRYLRPFFEGSSDLSFLSGVYDFSVSIPVGSKMNFVGSIPFVIMGGEEIETESGIGNIYIGLQHRLKSTAEKGVTLSFGAFLPTTPDDKYSVPFLGAITNYIELQKYFFNAMTIHGNAAYHRRHSNGLMYDLEIGPYLMVPTKGEEIEAELFLHYGISCGYRITDFILKAEFAGIGIITEEDYDFGDRFFHELVFGVLWDHGFIRPGIFYKLYLNKEWSESFHGVLGIKFQVMLK